MADGRPPDPDPPDKSILTRRNINLYSSNDSGPFEVYVQDTNLAWCKVLQMRRLNRRVAEEGKDITYIPTGTICVTFTGKKIPKEVCIYGLPMKVTPYISPILQCKNCLLYGHGPNQCRGTPKCKSWVLLLSTVCSISGCLMLGSCTQARRVYSPVLT